MNAEKALINNGVYLSYYATKGSQSNWQSWEFMPTLAKWSVWLNASVGEMVAESVRTNSGAERCRKKLSSLHRDGASAVCGVYRSAAERRSGDKGRSLREGGLQKKRVKFLHLVMHMVIKLVQLG